MQDCTDILTPFPIFLVNRKHHGVITHPLSNTVMLQTQFMSNVFRQFEDEVLH